MDRSPDGRGIRTRAPIRGYPKHKSLEEEAEEPEHPAQDEAERPPRGRDKMAYQPEYQPAPPRQYTTARGNRQDLQDILENKAGQPRSIYGLWGRAATRDDDRHAGYTKSKSGRAEHGKQDSYELRRDIARHRGAAHPLCFIDEVMDHEFPEGFKPINIESYDGTIDLAVWIEDFLRHTYAPR